MVNFSNFRTLDPEMADTARALIDGCDPRYSPFLPFMNGWMESVTDGGSDAAMISALAENHRLTNA